MANEQNVAETDLAEDQGSPIDDERSVETSSPSAGESEPDIPNYLGKAIVSLFCFPPTALIAVWFAGKVNDYIEAGENDRARAASQWVKKLSKISVILAPIWIIAVIVILIVRSRSS